MPDAIDQDKHVHPVVVPAIFLDMIEKLLVFFQSRFIALSKSLVQDVSVDHQDLRFLGVMVVVLRLQGSSNQPK